MQGLDNSASLHDNKHDQTHFKRPNTTEGETHGEAAEETGGKLTVSL